MSRYGAAGVWVGTRFVASEEAGAPPMHKELVLTAGYDDTIRTLIYSGRPMNVRKTPYVAEWESQRQQEMATLVSQGKIPHEAELEKHPDRSPEGRMCKPAAFIFRLDIFIIVSSGLMGKVAGSINVGSLLFP